MLDHLATGPLSRPDHDPALLAFIKCHVTSLAKWQALRALFDQPNCWHDVTSLSRHRGGATYSIGQALAALAAEGVIEQMHGPDGEPFYRLKAEDPTTTVVGRLIAAVGQSHELRQILVANLQQGQTTAIA